MPNEIVIVGKKMTKEQALERAREALAKKRRQVQQRAAFLAVLDREAQEVEMEAMDHRAFAAALRQVSIHLARRWKER